MKTKTWIILLGGVFLACLTAIFWPRGQANQAEIYCDGQLLRTVSLAGDQVFTLETPYGYNEITVSGGALAVTAADCPGGDCMAAGARSAGEPIVCLPHRLVIQLTGGESGVDTVS